MRIYFSMIDEIVACEGEFFPESLRTRTCHIRCHDCSYVGEAPYHFVFKKCPRCHSYNNTS